MTEVRASVRNAAASRRDILKDMQSRRGFAGLILALFCCPGRLRSAQKPASSPTPPLKPKENPPIPPQIRQYRADAAILLLGMTVFRRSSVGGGRASMEETGEGPSRRLELFFAAGSDPKRAHGLSRLGWIRESVVEASAAVTEATYFGVLTSSPEESLEHARKAVTGAQSGQSLYSAVSGRNTPGHSRSAITHFEFPASANWSEPRLIDEAQSTFRGTVAWRETSWPDSAAAPSTFLLALSKLLKGRDRHGSGRYVYNEQEYSMETEMPQPRAGKDGLLAVRGHVKNLKTGHATPFLLWLEDAPGSVVPVRIEFQPRSYLRLTFEAVHA